MVYIHKHMFDFLCCKLYYAYTNRCQSTHRNEYRGALCCSPSELGISSHFGSAAETLSGDDQNFSPTREKPYNEFHLPDAEILRCIYCGVIPWKAKN